MKYILTLQERDSFHAAIIAWSDALPAESEKLNTAFGYELDGYYYIDAWVLSRVLNKFAIQPVIDAVFPSGIPEYLEPLDEKIKKIITEAMEFGVELMTEYAANNVLAGYDKYQVKEISRYLRDVQRYLQSGSLYVALDEIQSLTPLEYNGVEIITQEQLDEFVQKIIDYLEIT